MDCTSTTYKLLLAVLVFLLLLWPIGVPATLYYQMHKQRDQILAEDPDTLAKFEFAIGDYKMSHYYWEVVELGRKLIMTGFISIFGRGSIFQVVVATAISFFFFAIALKEQPYRNKNLNIVKVFSEIQLSAILLTLVVLQTDSKTLATQTLSADFYAANLRSVSDLLCAVYHWRWRILTSQIEIGRANLRDS